MHEVLRASWSSSGTVATRVGCRARITTHASRALPNLRQNIAHSFDNRASFRGPGSIGVAPVPCHAPSLALRAVKRTTRHVASAAFGRVQEGAGLETLVDWVQTNGGAVEHIGVTSDGQDNAGWGMVAARDVAAGTQLIHLPAPLLLTFDKETDPALLRLIAKVPEELWGARLGLRVLAERARGPDSFWSPYINTLPAGFGGVPMFFGPDAIKALQYPPVTAQVNKRCRWLLGFAGELEAVRGVEGRDPFAAEVDANALGWALCAVTSRAFRVRGPKHPAAMLPLVDMCNHSFAANCETVPDGSGGIVMKAKKEVKRGEALMLNYGALSNDFLLLDYGFSIPSNPHDYVALRFDSAMIMFARDAVKQTDKDDPITELEAMQPWQRTALDQLQLHGSTANLELRVGGEQVIDGRFLGALRVLYCLDNVTPLKGLKLRELCNLETAVDPEVEFRALTTALGAAAFALNNFPTGAMEDEALLRDPTLDPNMRTAIEFRFAKKRGVVSAVEALALRIQAVSEKAATRSK